MRDQIRRVLTPRFGIGVFVVVLFVSAAWLLLLGPGYFLEHYAPSANARPLTVKEFLDLQNAYRVTYAQIIGGVILAIGAYLTWRTLQTNRETQITNRFATAIELLGAERDDRSPKIETRLGAIYALERLAHDSPRDHWTIVEILSAYVRENAPLNNLETPSIDSDCEPPKPRSDIQAALTVLARRNGRSEKEHGQIIDLSKSYLDGVSLDDAHLEAVNFSEAHLSGADLAHASLMGADLSGADLRRVGLIGANLTGANLVGADLARAHLLGADLTGAGLVGTDLTRADLLGANLTRAILIKVNLTGANLAQAELKGADLLGANLTEAHLLEVDLRAVDLRNALGLTVDQIRSAWTDSTTLLPPDVGAPIPKATKAADPPPAPDPPEVSPDAS